MKKYSAIPTPCYVLESERLEKKRQDFRNRAPTKRGKGLARFKGVCVLA